MVEAFSLTIKPRVSQNCESVSHFFSNLARSLSLSLPGSDAFST